MTTVITTATSSIVSMVSDDVIYVAASGSIIKTSGGAAIMSSSAVPVDHATVVIDGVVARLAAPQAGFTAAVIATAYDEGGSGNNSFSIGRTGVVRSNTDGLILRDANNTVENLGLIDVQGDAVVMDKGGAVTNLGLITAANAVIINGATATIRNSGQIIATATAINSAATTASLINSGSVTATVTGISMDGGTQSLLNIGSVTGGGGAGIAATGLLAGRIDSSGEVHATGATGTGILVSASNALVLNLSGDISAGANGLFTETSINLRLINAATITAGTFGIKMLGADGLRMDNSGSVTAWQGVSVAGNNVVVGNSGSIHGLTSDGMVASGAVFTLHNTGSIEGAARGFAYTGSAVTGGNLVLDNAASGAIHGGTYGISVAYTDVPGPTVQARISNAGEVSGVLAGIQISGLPVVLHNSGTIYASAGPAIAVNGEQNIRIVNSGVIEAALPFGTGPAVAINLAGVLGGGANTLLNFGSILGDVQMGDQVSTVRNRGLIAGDLDLGLGNDIYDGRGGEVTGAVLGNGGNDLLTGSAGSDALFGGDGVDRLRGGAGDDVLQGGAGRDLLTGNAGSDTFVFDRMADLPMGQSQDHIVDFEAGIDKIALAFGPDKIFIGAADFGNHAGEIRYLRASGLIQGDIDGDGKVDFALVLDNHATLTAADFGL